MLGDILKLTKPKYNLFKLYFQKFNFVVLV